MEDALIDDFSKAELDSQLGLNKSSLKPSSDLPEKNSQKGSLPYCGHSACKSTLDAVMDPTRYIHSGHMYKKKSALQKRLRRWFVVVEGHLVYYDDKRNLGRTMPKGVVHLSHGCHLEDTDPSSNFFHVNCESPFPKRLNLEADSISEKRKWISIFRAQLGFVRIRIDSCMEQAERLTALLQSENTSQSSTIQCADCDEMVDLDCFTLAQHCGFLTKRGGGRRCIVWDQIRVDLKLVRRG